MKVSKFFKLHNDILAEWVYDSEAFLTEDYTITIDTLNKKRIFSNQSYTAEQPSSSSNITENQSFLIDGTKNKWGLVDINKETNKYYYIQNRDFSGNIPHRYDTVKLHFPVSYNFPSNNGLILNINLLNESQTAYYSISNYIYDKTNPLREDIEYTAPPFMFQERLWGKFIELKVPSPSVVVNDISLINNVKTPREGGIHKNLGGGDLLSQNSPIFIQFQFINNRFDNNGMIYYLTEEPFKTSIPMVPEFEQLGVQINESDQGDYFEINGTYSGNISEFSKFIENAPLIGKNFYALYEITTLEKNMITNTLTITQTEEFDNPIEFRPIIKFSSTTAILDVKMKLINTVDESVITRTSSYTMIQDEVSKYSRNLSKINISNTFKPKIYNSKPDSIVVPSSTGNSTVNKIKVPVSSMYERYNISTRNVSENINDTTYYGLGAMEILIYPTDNIFKFAISNGSDNNGIKPFSIPNDASVIMRFKSDSKVIDLPLYNESTEINLSNGIVVFMLLESQYPTIKKIYDEGYKQFYILMKNSSNISTVIYPGRFLLY